MNGERHPWWLGPAALLGAALLWLLARSWRLDVRRPPGYDGSEQVIFAFWHARQLPLVYVHRGEGAAVLVSRSRDGELISRILARFGLATARGSSTRGGEAAIRELQAAARDGRCLAFTPDGPRGPAQRAKGGVTRVAADTGLRIVPIATAARDAWVLRSWDRFRVPRPFARVCVVYGPPLAVGRGSDPGTAERERARVEEALAACTAEAVALAGERA